jgi:nucleoid-associated protein YgaU
MQQVCEEAGDPEGTVDILGWNPNCSTYARVYYEAVDRYGGDAFERRQQEACECEAREPEETEEDGPIELEPTEIEVKVYTVTPGDTLWDIAEREYDDGQKWPVIFEKNKKTEDNPDGIEDPDLIYPGQTLIIPSQSEADAFDRSEYERPG